MQWFYADEARVQHAVTSEELPALAASGTLSSSTLVWNEAMAGWQPAATVLPDLFPATATPPLLTAAQRREIAPPAGPAFPGQRGTADPVAICALVFGILSILLCGPFLGLPAVICGHLARGRAREETLPSSNGGLALAGLITGYFGLILSLLVIAFYVVAILVGIASGIDDATPATP